MAYKTLKITHNIIIFLFMLNRDFSSNSGYFFSRFRGIKATIKPVTEPVKAKTIDKSIILAWKNKRSIAPATNKVIDQCGVLYLLLSFAKKEGNRWSRAALKRFRE